MRKTRRVCGAASNGAALGLARSAGAGLSASRTWATKWAIACGTPFSRILKSSCFRSVIGRPSLSTTRTSSGTIVTPDLKAGGC